MTDEKSETTSSDLVQTCNELRKSAFDKQEEDEFLMCEHVVQCVSIMKAHPDDRQIQNCATLALTALSEKRQLHQFIGECDGVEVLLLSLQKFIQDQGMVKNTLVLFRSLFVCVANRHRFRIHSGLKLLTRAMTLHPNRAGVQRISCFLISVFSCEPEIQRFRLVENGVIPPIMNILNRFDKAGDRAMHMDACVTLTNLTRHVGMCEQVVEADCYLRGISGLVEEGDHEVAYAALGILRNIMMHHKTVKFPLGVERRITWTLLVFLEKSSINPLKYGKCHEASFSLLRSELLSEDHVLEPTSFLKLCLTYLRVYLGTATIQEHAVVAHSCACIRMMLFAAHNRVEFRRMADSIETLVSAIRFLASRPIRVEQALLALGNAVFDSEESQARAEEANCLQTIAGTMERNDFNAAVTIAGFQAIHAVCANNHQTVEKAIALNTEAVCVKALRAFKDNPHVQEAGLATIATLAHNTAAVQALRRSLALKVVRRAPEQFPFSQKILLLTESIEELMDGKPAPSNQRASQEEVRKLSLASRLIRKLSSKPLSGE